jgi:DNA-binding winged helix-turn-helix (wHTH) protein
VIKGRTKLSYTFGTFRVDVTQRVLFNENRPVSLTPKAFDTLLALVQHSGHVVSTEELMSQVWPDSFVEGNNLAQNISTLRKVLGARGAKFIETVPKRGYRFVADVREIRDEAPNPVSPERDPASPRMEDDAQEMNQGRDAPALQSFARRIPATIDLARSGSLPSLSKPELRPRFEFAKVALGGRSTTGQWDPPRYCY